MQIIILDHDLLEKHSRPPYSSERRRQLAKVDVTSGADSRGSELVRAYAPAALSSFAPTFALALTPPSSTRPPHVLRQLSPPHRVHQQPYPPQSGASLAPPAPQAERCADSHDRSAARCRRPPETTPGAQSARRRPPPGPLSDPHPPYPSVHRSSSSLPLPPHLELLHLEPVARAADPPSPHLLFGVASPFHERRAPPPLSPSFSRN
ncbi:BQ5605_C052g12593 [Microbotryum silenes-dioicae]|uniref:BQ5605_C052g12593 protein n=1 Tax=Microbotryum silenes-dioicae TaxID=796604 RepID=A0A2X0MRY5_9BASI|nr:BQ5605_C052g12593 [Microbotryum silenes-dioicae]